MDQLNLTVHHFTRSPPVGTSASQSVLLQNGRNLLTQASWRQPQSVKLCAEKNGTARFIYAQTPPSIENVKRSVVPKLKNWGAPAEGDEVFRLHDLLEFESTDLHHAGLQIVPKPASTHLETGTTAASKATRISLYQVIPQPHFMPSPQRVFRRKATIGPFRKSEPIPIVPYAIPFNQLGGWDQCAWIIPISGTLPWADSTSGILLEPSYDTPAPPNIQVNRITWTRNALSHFWSFLVALRNAGTLGPLGLSLHLSPLHRSSDKSIRGSKNLAVSRQPEIRIGDGSAHTRAVSISAIDHIKIYHEWQSTLQLRNVLDAWGFEIDEHKVRVFVGAKFVLLDDRSRGIMVL